MSCREMARDLLFGHVHPAHRIGALAFDHTERFRTPDEGFCPAEPGSDLGDHPSRNPTVNYSHRCCTLDLIRAAQHQGCAKFPGLSELETS